MGYELKLEIAAIAHKATQVPARGDSSSLVLSEVSDKTEMIDHTTAGIKDIFRGTKGTSDEAWRISAASRASSTLSVWGSPFTAIVSYASATLASTRTFKMCTCSGTVYTLYW